MAVSFENEDRPPGALHYEPGEFQLRPLAENLRHASGFKRFSDLRRDGA